MYLLSSNAGAWLTGVEITVDGGALLKVDIRQPERHCSNDGDRWTLMNSS